MLLLVWLLAPLGLAAPTFVMEGNSFMRDGQPFPLYSGEIHYSRVPEEYWEDRLQRLAAMGLNSIQTYVPWNWHEANEGHFDFTSPGRNLTKFILTAADAGLLVTVRAGPYMCGEWEFGGFPAWLWKNGTIPLRTYAEPYMSAVTKYWDQLLPPLEPLLYKNGGPVVMVQLENEYGSYGNTGGNPKDLQYMQALLDQATRILGTHNKDVIFMTTDGGSDSYMSHGTIKGDTVLSLGDGCGNPQTCIDAQQKYNDPGPSPFMCSECYSGWLTHWGEAGANTSSTAPQVESIIGKFGGSISLYMGHGGTNFGFWSGANSGGGYQPHETSYDYDSPVSEAGEHGYHGSVDKYLALETVFMVHQPHAQARAEPALPPRASFGSVRLDQKALLVPSLSLLSPQPASTGDVQPPFAEQAGCWYGFIMYSSDLTSSGSALSIAAYSDRVQVFLDGVHVASQYRNAPGDITVSAQAHQKLQLLVENMGRINYGHAMDTDLKGILGKVTLDGTEVNDWTTNCLPLDPADVGKLVYSAAGNTTGPAFYSGTFSVDTPADTFLSSAGWNKGIAWVNGFNLGRYWEPQGPQHTLFVPAPRLRKGTNTLVVLELETAPDSYSIDFLDHPELRPVPKACDPTKPPAEGSKIAMASQAGKLAHAQQWNLTSDGAWRLQALPDLCLTVQAGCPHPSTGCLILSACGDSKDQVWQWREDPTQQGAHVLVHVDSGNCLDIYSHDATEGAPLELYACSSAGEDNQRWAFDATMGILKSYQSGPTSSDFVVSTCTL